MSSKMKQLPLWVAALAIPGTALANADVAKLIKDPKNWAMQAGNFENQRYSTLNQINKSNVKNMKVAWTFSTGVLRGHEGGPLVIGDTLFVHSPFPNKVFAIDLETQKIKWKYEPKQDPSVIPVMRPAGEPDVLRFGQPLHLEPVAASGRQQVVDDPVGA